MKKITLALGAVLIATASFGQTTVVDATNGDFDTIITGNTRVSTAPCAFSEDSNGFENGLGNTNLTIEVGDDFTVPDGENFTLEAITFNMITAGTFTDVTVRVYEHDGATFPDVQLLDEVIIPLSITDIGDAFGRDVLEVVVELPVPLLLPGEVGADTTYWISIWTPNGDGADAFWETSTVSPSPLNVVFKLGADPDGWADGGGPTACVFVAEGDCELILSVGDNLADLVNIYPNPATTIVNIDAPASVEILGATLFDVLGKNTGVSLNNGTIDVSNLSRGVYILKVQSAKGTLTQKLIKR